MAARGLSGEAGRPRKKIGPFEILCAEVRLSRMRKTTTGQLRDRRRRATAVATPPPPFFRGNFS
jgi:hypothetical protein